MVTVLEVKERSDVEQSQPEDSSLREERRRTGRYVATVIAIFVSLFGLYQALARGTPEYAAFFLPALIMFLYVLWILYASRTRSRVSADELEQTQPLDQYGGENTPPASTSQYQRFFSRSYSIA